MQSLSIYARLFARALGGTEAESILLNSLLRLSSTTPSAITYSSNRLAITYPSAALQRTVHLVTASSGYSGHHSDKTECLTQSRQRTSSSLESKSNVFGDDAFFVAKHRLGDFLGVADGVGSWHEHGIDPSLFSSSLMNACKSLIDNKLLDLNPLTLKELLSKAYKQLLENKQCILGSSTACIVALHRENRILHTANLGDSGFVVIRKKAIVHRSQEQQHYFNSPFQLAIHPTMQDPRLIADSPDIALVTSFNVEENDFIVIATDGLWDNLPDATILEEIQKIREPTRDNLQRIAHTLAKRALRNGHDPNFYSPFARSAKRSLGINICDMLEITEQFIYQCSLTLGQFDSESVNLLVALFHHQSANSQLTHLSPTLREKFQNLLTCKADDVDERNNDTPLTRIELATMIYFKQNYLPHAAERSKHHQRLPIEDELNLAYCFLLAAIDDRVSEHQLNELKFFMNIRSPVTTLFEIYKDLGNSFSQFFARLQQCGYFAARLVQVNQTILDFQLFIKRYEDFLLTFAELYHPHSENAAHSMQNDAILDNRDAREIGKFMIELISSNREQMKSPTESAGLSPKARRTTLTAPTSPIKVPTSPIKTPTSPTPRSPVQRTVLSTAPASNVPRKALCVIINISKFTSSQSFDTPARAGSEKDVNLIKIIFNKLNFTILECRFDFKKADLDRALDHIDDRSIYGHFDCLAIFIMSHGLLHSFFTADSKEVIIRDIVRRFSDSSPTTIWTGKTRLFFIQACRSLWPIDVPSSTRQDIHRTDLSPGMLVAYSCKPSEASKRSPTSGSLFIQIFCIMLLHYGHYLNIHAILDWTARFVIKRDEFFAQHKGCPLSIQQPEYIERDFSSKFRFCNDCLYDQHTSWAEEKKIALHIPLSIWRGLYDLIFKSNGNE